MENIIFGVITTSICVLSYSYSWSNYKKEKYDKALIFIVFSGFLLYCFSASDFFLHAWDERFHALVAKNLTQNPIIPKLYSNPVLPFDFRSWTSNNIWLHKQPLPLWLIAGSLKVFGVNEFALRLPSILMSTIGIVLTYRVGSFFFNKRVGLFSAFLFSINGLINELTAGRITTDHVDIAFMFFVLLSIYLSTLFISKKSLKYSFLIGLTIGAAVLSKWLAGLIVLPIWLLLVLDSNSFSIRSIAMHFAIILCVIALVALPWQFYAFWKFPLEAAYESNYNFRHFTEVIEEHSGSMFYFFNKIRVNYGELIYLPLIWFLWGMLKRPYNLKRLALLIWFLVPFVIFSIAETKMQGYLLFTAPALFIITSAFFFFLLDYKRKVGPKWVFNLILALFIILPIRYGIERIKPFEKIDRNPQWVSDLKALDKQQIQNGILFNYANPIEAMFYTDLIVYPTMPSSEQLEELKKEGYVILINNAEKLEDFENLEGVRKLNLTAK